MIDIPSDTVLQQIADVVGKAEPITWQQVGRVLAAYRDIHAGDPVGTIRRDPDTGAIATRVSDEGLHLWRVSVPSTGLQYNNLEPTLPWPELG